MKKEILIQYISCPFYSLDNFLLIIKIDYKAGIFLNFQFKKLFRFFTFSVPFFYTYRKINNFFVLLELKLQKNNAFFNDPSTKTT